MLLAANHTNLFTDSDRKQNASSRQHTVRPWDDSMITDATRNISHPSHTCQKRSWCIGSAFPPAAWRKTGGKSVSEASSLYRSEIAHSQLCGRTPSRCAGAECIHNDIWHILWSTLVTSSSDETTCSGPTILHSPVNSAGAHSGAFHGWAQHASSSKPTTHPSNQKHQDDRGNSKTLDLWAVVKASTSSSHTDPLCSQTAVLLRC